MYHLTFYISYFDILDPTHDTPTHRTHLLHTPSQMTHLHTHAKHFFNQILFHIQYTFHLREKNLIDVFTHKKIVKTPFILNSYNLWINGKHKVKMCAEKCRFLRFEVELLLCLCSINNLHYIPWLSQKFFFQPIYTDYAN